MALLIWLMRHRSSDQLIPRTMIHSPYVLIWKLMHRPGSIRTSRQETLHAPRARRPPLGGLMYRGRSTSQPVRSRQMPRSVGREASRWIGSISCNVCCSGDSLLGQHAGVRHPYIGAGLLGRRQSERALRSDQGLHAEGKERRYTRGRAPDPTCSRTPGSSNHVTHLEVVGRSWPGERLAR